MTKEIGERKAENYRPELLVLAKLRLRLDSLTIL